MRGLKWYKLVLLLMQLVVVVVVVMIFPVRLVQCQPVSDNDYDGIINTTQLNDPMVLNRFTEIVYQRLTSVTTELIHSEIAQKATFCVNDP